jgi:FAD synthetase
VLKVIVFGTFDIFHEGHRNFFKQAKELGDFLIVVVAREENVLKIKGALPWNDEETRLAEIKNSELVSKAILGGKNRVKDYKYLILRQEKPDVVCLGYDQQVDLDELQKMLKKYKLNKTKVVKLEAYKPEKYKSSLLKKI